MSELSIELSDKLAAYDRIRQNQRKHSKAYMARISQTDEYKKKQRDYYEQNKEVIQERQRKNWTTYYNKTGKAKKQEYYDTNRTDINCKQSYRYYKKHKSVEAFIEKFPNRYERLIEIGFIEEL